MRHDVCLGDLPECTVHRSCTWRIVSQAQAATTAPRAKPERERVAEDGPCGSEGSSGSSAKIMEGSPYVNTVQFRSSVTATRRMDTAVGASTPHMVPCSVPCPGPYPMAYMAPPPWASPPCMSLPFGGMALPPPGIIPPWGSMMMPPWMCMPPGGVLPPPPTPLAPRAQPGVPPPVRGCPVLTPTVMGLPVDYHPIGVMPHPPAAPTPHPARCLRPMSPRRDSRGTASAGSDAGAVAPSSSRRAPTPATPRN